MAKLFMVSQCSLLLPHIQPHSFTSRWSSGAVCYTEHAVASHLKSVSPSKDNHVDVASLRIHHAHLHRNPLPWKGTSAAFDFDAADLSAEREVVEVDVEEATIIEDGGGFGDDDGKYHGGGGGGGGGDNDSNTGDKGSDENSGGDKKAHALSMSQKLTLGFAALVGLGGVMGYLKSGSQKSLASGGLSALLLYFVYTLLPKYPALASSVGLGISGALLIVMGSRFKNSGKIFPAGFVALVSLVMTGGYLHGILRSTH